MCNTIEGKRKPLWLSPSVLFFTAKIFWLVVSLDNQFVIAGTLVHTEIKPSWSMGVSLLTFLIAKYSALILPKRHINEDDNKTKQSICLFLLYCSLTLQYIWEKLLVKYIYIGHSHKCSVKNHSNIFTSQMLVFILLYPNHRHLGWRPQALMDGPG